MTIIGRIFRKMKQQNNILVQHFIKADPHPDLTVDYNNRSIVQCPGCHLNDATLLNFCKNPPNQLRKIFGRPITYATCIKGYNALTAIVVERNKIPHPVKKTTFIMKQTPDNYI